MNIADELSRLQELRAQGVLTDEEFAQAKAAQLSGYSSRRSAEQSTQPSASLEDIHFQNELARLDREWMLGREKFMVMGRYGTRSIPTEGSNLIMAIIIGIFGIIWTIQPHLSLIPFGPLLSIAVTIFSIGVFIHRFIKAGEYKKAEQDYRRRRARLLAQRPTSPRNIS